MTLIAARLSRDDAGFASWAEFVAAQGGDDETA
jgi:hypothetical protein